MTKTELKQWFDKNRSRIQAEYFELLRFQSIGADPTKLGECANCATWIKKFLKGLGFDVTLEQSDIHLPPVLIAERLVNDSPHTILFYGHYDVQPVDPLDAWQTPPFEPEIRGNRVYARGAQDDKGQWFSCLQGLRALIENNRKLPSIKIILEGQEESGSAAIASMAYKLKDRIAADVLLVCDTGKDASGRPSIVAGLRGVLHFTLTLQGPNYDLHSGQHGGIAPNPAQGIVEMLASLHTETGAIAVKGFCDSVVMPSKAEQELSTAVPFDTTKYEAEIGVPPCGGERDLPVVTRMSFMPTIEINGVHSGYGGPGSKTVIPSKAIAKLSCRLVPDQSPTEVFNLIKQHFAEHCPAGMTFEISEFSGGEPGFRLPLNSPAMRWAADVLTELDERGPVFAWEGASIPIVAKLRDITGAAPLLVGFGMQEDRIHCPNESFSFEQFEESVLWGGLIFQAFAEI